MVWVECREEGKRRRLSFVVYFVAEKKGEGVEVSEEEQSLDFDDTCEAGIGKNDLSYNRRFIPLPAMDF